MYWKVYTVLLAILSTVGRSTHALSTVGGGGLKPGSIIVYIPNLCHVMTLPTYWFSGISQPNGRMEGMDGREKEA